MAIGDELALVSDPKEEEEEEELVDPQDEKKETCTETSDCLKYKAVLDDCNERVGAAGNSEETCEEELFDFFHCVDTCVAKDLFKKLK